MPIMKAANTILRPGLSTAAQDDPSESRDGGGGAVRTGYSNAADARVAVAELRAQIAQPDPGLVLFFCSPAYDRDTLAAAMAEAFPGVLTLGCTTAGEITPLGYMSGSLTGLSLDRAICHAEAVCITQLKAFAFTHGADAVRSLLGRMREARGPQFSTSTFAMLMIDGMSGAEDSVLSALHAGMGEIPLFGGSAGDDLNFKETFVFTDGRFHADAAVLVMVHTSCPFRVFKTQHFVGSDNKMVITGADPLKRIVTEINAEPAGHEFARMVGLEVEQLSPMIFATHPVVVKVGGADYVRSIQKVNADGSLSFFCAIDEGLVLSVGQSVDPYENLRAVFADIVREIGRPQLIIGCECVLRFLEMKRVGLKQAMGDMLIDHHVVGFNTYGEQFNAMHVNQTFTGVALGCLEA